MGGGGGGGRERERIYRRQVVRARVLWRMVECVRGVYLLACLATLTSWLCV